MLLITSALYLLWFETIESIVLIIAVVNAWTLTSSVPKREKERSQFIAMIQDGSLNILSKQVVKIRLLKFLGLTIATGISFDLLVNYLISIDYGNIAGYKAIYSFGYILLIPLLIAITNWEHLGVVYERYVTRDRMSGYPLYYGAGMIAAIAYASFDQTSGVIMALLLSFGTAYHIFYSIPPVMKGVKK